MTILDDAAEITSGDRMRAYGPPAENHGCTAALWSAYLRRRGLLAEGAALDARDVCLLNALQKISRDANMRKRDNLMDLAGYARNAEMVEATEQGEAG